MIDRLLFFDHKDPTFIDQLRKPIQTR